MLRLPGLFTGAKVVVSRMFLSRRARINALRLETHLSEFEDELACFQQFVHTVAEPGLSIRKLQRGPDHRRVCSALQHVLVKLKRTRETL